MSKIMKPPSIRKGDCIVVCDGRKMVILENKGDELFPNLHATIIRERLDRPTHELGTDRPGRVHESVGASRSAMEQANLHEQAEVVFIMDLAKELTALVSVHPDARLIIVAPPRALAIFRKAYTARLKNSIAAELDKDWVNESIAKIEKHLFTNV